MIGHGTGSPTPRWAGILVISIAAAGVPFARTDSVRTLIGVVAGA